MTKSELHQMIADSSGNEINICQIYEIKNGSVVFNDCWRGYKTTDAVNVMSVTKSVMALLVGIAIDKGYIKNVNQNVIDFFPDYQVKRGEKTIYKVTLRHLLTMTAPYKYRSEPWTKVCTSEDWTKAALDMLGGRNGITGEFKYATLGIQIISGVIQNASGMKCIDFANQYLFAPLSIPAHTIHGASDKDDQFDFLMNKAPKKNEWYSDPKDTVTAGWGLCLSAKDMAKIGVLILNSGEYDNKRIISTNWIEEMTAPRIALGERFGNMHYGYLWYRPHKDKQIVAAIGDGGNVIYVNIEKNISVGVTATFKPRVFDRIEFIEKNILPLIT